MTTRDDPLERLPEIIGRVDAILRALDAHAQRLDRLAQTVASLRGEPSRAPAEGGPEPGQPET